MALMAGSCDGRRAPRFDPGPDPRGGRRVDFRSTRLLPFAERLPCGSEFAAAFFAPPRTRVRFRVRSRCTAGGGWREVTDVVHEPVTPAGEWFEHRLRLPAGPHPTAPVEFSAASSGVQSAWLAWFDALPALRGARVSDPQPLHPPAGRSLDARSDRVMLGVEDLSRAAAGRLASGLRSRRGAARLLRCRLFGGSVARAGVEASYVARIEIGRIGDAPLRARPGTDARYMFPDAGRAAKYASSLLRGLSERGAWTLVISPLTAEEAGAALDALVASAWEAGSERLIEFHLADSEDPVLRGRIRCSAEGAPLSGAGRRHDPADRTARPAAGPPGIRRPGVPLGRTAAGPRR